MGTLEPVLPLTPGRAQIGLKLAPVPALGRPDPIILFMIPRIPFIGLFAAPDTEPVLSL